MHDARIVERIDYTVAISVTANGRCLIASGRLILDGIGNCVIVTVEVQKVLDAVAVGINGRCAELIPGSIAIGIGKASSGRFGGVNHAAHIGISRDRYGISTLHQITDAVVVTVEIAAVMDPIPVGIGDRKKEAEVVVEIACVSGDALQRSGRCLRYPLHWLLPVTSSSSIPNHHVLVAGLDVCVACF